MHIVIIIILCNINSVLHFSYTQKTPPKINLSFDPLYINYIGQEKLSGEASFCVNEKFVKVFIEIGP